MVWIEVEGEREVGVMEMEVRRELGEKNIGWRRERLVMHQFH